MASASKALNIIVEDGKHCTPCKTKNKKIESQYYCTDCEAYYCEDCFELHPRVPYLAKHIVLKHDDIAVWSKVQFKCTTHNKTLEFFCGKHKLLCCHVCVSLKHRSCADMEYILESAKNIHLNDEIKTMVQRTHETLDKVDSYANEIKNKMEMNQKSKTEYIKELEEVRSRLNKIFDALMKNALEEMGKRFDENTKYSDEMTRELKSFQNELQDLMHQLTTSTAGKEGLIYISLKRGENLAEEITRKLSEIDITTNKDNFKPVLDNGVLEYFGNLRQIAYLEDEQMRQEALSLKESVSSEEYKEQESVLCGENIVYEETVAAGKIEVPEYLPAEEYKVQESVAYGKIEVPEDVPCEETEVQEPDAYGKWEVPEVVPCEEYEVKESVAYGNSEVPEVVPFKKYEAKEPVAYGKWEVPEVVPCKEYEAKEPVAYGKLEVPEHVPCKEYEVKEPVAYEKWEVPEVVPFEEYEAKEPVAYEKWKVPEVLPCEEYEAKEPVEYGKLEVPENVPCIEYEVKESVAYGNSEVPKVVPFKNMKRRNQLHMGNGKCQKLYPVKNMKRRNQLHMGNWKCQNMYPVKNMK